VIVELKSNNLRISHGHFRFLAPRRRTDQAIKQNQQHDNRECDVHAILFFCEAEDGERNASHRSSDQQQQTKLDDAAAIECKRIGNQILPDKPL